MRKKRTHALFEKYDPVRSAKKKSTVFTARYIGITAVFLLVCLFYVIKLVDIQSKGEAGSHDDNGHFTRTYTVAGVRGEIYDRNGVLLVGNEVNHDIIFEYGAIPDTTAEFNRSILATLEAIERAGASDCLSKDYYVLEGSYPDLTYSNKLADRDSDEYKYLLRILDTNKMHPSEASEKELVKMLCNKYKLFEDLYTNEEITALLRVRYELERVQFGYYNSYTLAENVPAELVSYIEESGINGVNFKIDSERVYHYPGYASHILGRVGKIQAEDLEYYKQLGYSMNAYVGTSGCEKAFESYLHAEDGVLAVEYDADGSVVQKYYELEPISGNDVYLTIDIKLQIAAEDTIKESITAIESAEAGSAVALDPNSGAIYAIASYPTFDLTKISEIDYYNSLLENPHLPELNRALSGVYPPGSVYKIGAALAALEEGHITSSSTYTCNKVFPHLHGPTCLGNHGVSSVTEAIRDSCNVFFYYLGMEMGIDNITKYTKPLGLGVATGIELPERVGMVAGRLTASSWSAGNDLSAAIGQANHGYTPLQLGVYTSTLTNGGTRYKAHLLDSVRQFYTGKVIYEYEPEVLETVEISRKNVDTVLEGMRLVVESNQNIKYNFSSTPVTVGGKTGTAQVDGKADYALFAGAAPYNDPEIVGVCVIEEGAAGGLSSKTVSEIFKAYYEQKKALEEDLSKDNQTTPQN